MFISRSVLVIWLCLACAMGVYGGERSSQIDFTNDIVPVLTKLGCNSGGCHGKATGRGGFKLSLFGFESREDFEAIAHGSRGRRVFPAAPAQSLLLRKATMAMPHGGGRRAEPGSPAYEILSAWIQAETPWGPAKAPQLERLEIHPSSERMGRDADLQLAVTAVYSDDSRRDVTWLTRFDTSDPAIASVDSQGLVHSENATGEAAVIAQYQDAVGVCRILIPAANTSAAGLARIEQFPTANFIDDQVLEKLKQLRVPPAKNADDGTYLRRVTLQIAGRLPTLQETQAFLADHSRDKRSALVERLLASGDYADYFAQKWSDLLRNKRRGQKPRIPGTIAFHRWIRDALAAEMPYDRFVREILAATGNVTVNPPAQWYAEVRYLDRYVDDTAQVFLGVRIGCARCHHHPFEKYSQDDYYGLAGFFSRVGRRGGAGVAERRADETVFVKATGEVKHPKTGQVVQPHGLGAKPVTVAQYDDPRQHLADWMADPENPYFGRAFVNRMWAHFFGRGLVEPMDDLRVTNPATNETLLDALAEEFVRSRFDMKHVIRLICNSSTYQLASQATQNLSETRSHARFYPQRLTAEVLLDAIDVVSGVKTNYTGLPASTRAVQLPDENYSNMFLRLFGRPMRESACECERQSAPSLSQALFSMNDSFLLAKATSPQGYAARLGADQREAGAKVQELFLVAFCRQPDDRELKDAVQYIESESDPKRAFANLLWALTNTKEFMYVH